MVEKFSKREYGILLVYLHDFNAIFFYYIQAAICCSLWTINQIPPSLLLICSACFLDAHLMVFIACNSPRIGNTSVSSCTVIALKSERTRVNSGSRSAKFAFLTFEFNGKNNLLVRRFNYNRLVGYQ